MSARVPVAGAVLVVGMMLGWGGFILASYALWEVVSLVGDLAELGRRGLRRRESSTGRTIAGRMARRRIYALENALPPPSRGMDLGA